MKMSFRLNSNIVQWLLLLLFPLGFVFESCVMAVLLLNYRWCNVVRILFLSLLLLAHFSITILLYDYSLKKPAEQILLITVYFLGYSVFFKHCVNDIDSIWNKYLRVCEFFSLLAIIQLCFMVILNIDPFYFATLKETYETNSIMHIRLHAYFGEPGPFAMFLLPYITYGFFTMKYKGVKKSRFFFVAFVFSLTFSAMGYLMLFLILLYKWCKSKSVLKIFAISGGLVLLNIVISNGSNSQIKADTNQLDASLIKISDTFTAFKNVDPGMFEVLNLSSYATLSNLWVSFNAPNRIIGTGIGTHSESYSRIYKSDFSHYGLNQHDAYSILIRVFSEFGFIGISILFLFLYRLFNRLNIINISILPYLLAHLIRGGHYTINGMFFFCMLYYLTSKTDRNER